MIIKLYSNFILKADEYVDFKIWSHVLKLIIRNHLQFRILLIIHSNIPPAQFMGMSSIIHKVLITTENIGIMCTLNNFYLNKIPYNII